MSRRDQLQFLGACAAAALLSLGLAAVSTHAQTNESQQSPQTSASSDPADQALAARVTQALRNDQGLNSRHLKVSVRQGEVTLGGFAQDNRAVLTAQQVATKAAPGHTIINNIRIEQGQANAP